MSNQKKRYRILFRVRLAHLALVGELDITTSKEKWDIDHEGIVQKYLAALGNVVVFDEILDTTELT